MTSYQAMEVKETTGLQQCVTVQYQNATSRYHVYPYQVGGTLEVTVQQEKAVATLSEEGCISASSYSKQTLEAVLVQRKIASMQCDPPLITSVPGYMAYISPPPPECLIKDELVQRQEEFIIECMYPKRILPSNAKLREDSRPLSPSQIPGIKLTMREIYGPERSPSSIRGCISMKRRSPSIIRRRRRSVSTKRFRSRTRSRSPIRSNVRDRSPSLRPRSPFYRYKTPSPRIRSISPHLRSSPYRRTPKSKIRKRSPRNMRTPSPRLRSLSPVVGAAPVRLSRNKFRQRLRSLTPYGRSPDSRRRSISQSSRSISPPSRWLGSILRRTTPSLTPTRSRQLTPPSEMSTIRTRSVSSREKTDSPSSRSSRSSTKSPEPRLRSHTPVTRQSDSILGSDSDDQLSSIESSSKQPADQLINNIRINSLSPTK